MIKIHELGLSARHIATVQRLQEGNPNKRLSTATLRRVTGMGNATIAKLRLGGFIDDGAFPSLHALPARVPEQLAAKFANEAELREELVRYPGQLHVKGLSPAMWKRIAKALSLDGAPVAPLTREEMLAFIRDAAVALRISSHNNLAVSADQQAANLVLAIRGDSLLARAKARYTPNKE